MTSDLTPSAAPTIINELRAKNPEPTHPNRDPITQPASLIWPQKADTDVGTRFSIGLQMQPGKRAGQLPIGLKMQPGKRAGQLPSCPARFAQLSSSLSRLHL
jgi:hypothetical protein